MPKRSDREVFKGAFDGNPFAKLSPQQIYSKIQWGNKPKKIFNINAPEPLVALGTLAELHFKETKVVYNENEFFIAIGANSNILYFVPIGKPIIEIPNFGLQWKKGKFVHETHYYSDKGGEECYYYHEHEKPFPRLYGYKNFGLLIPSNNNGKRSYAVIKEGIVG